MSLTLLLDLDDTLLDTNLEAFMPAYFQALAGHLAEHSMPASMLRALIAGVNLMNESEDPAQTLEEIFDAYFYPALGYAKQDLVQIIDGFYEEVFPLLAQHTRPKPEAVPLVEWASAKPPSIACAGRALYRNASSWFPPLNTFISRRLTRPITPKCSAGLAGPKERS
jgi:hypothetical protein